MKTVIGSRGSDLALWQANFVQDKLNEIGVETEIKIIKTKGDKIQHLSFDKMEGKGFFTKEIEEALLNKEIDLAVHSHKDLETDQPKGLTISAVSARANPADVLLIRKESVDEKRKFALKKSAIVGTSSARRKTQILAFRQDLKIKDLRGNVPTRIEKLRKGDYDAILLAAAGLNRLELDVSDLHKEEMNPKEFIPAPAQGVLALQTREEDKELINALQGFNNEEVQRTSAIERKILNLFDGGCQLPLGVFCEQEEDDNGKSVYGVWAAKAESANKIPVYLHFRSSKMEVIPKTIVSKFNTLSPTSVFITRDLNDNDFFKNTLSSNGFEVHGKALIKINRITFKKLPKVEWVFFASKNAVRHFFSQNPNIGDAKIAAIGRTTAAEVRKYGKRAEFIGYSTDTTLTTKQFLAVAGNRKILFPQAKGSIRRVQEFMKPENAIDLPVYESIQQDGEYLPKTNVLFFTSPSNVMAYFKHNKITPQQDVIAMGHATEKALRHNRVDRCFQPPSFDGVGMVMAVMGLNN